MQAYQCPAGEDRLSAIYDSFLILELIDTNTPSFEDALMQKSGRILSTNAQDGFMRGVKRLEG
ncbi:hypothetical protein CKC_03095 [Candidatus Liberibacter solanacearum CLso-ZC1]|uniref:Uncharacterized protein n=1 Tax=Liberibacter solanacearum (strain CLso-ZC1) TaxID=658172 RepID=E4UAX7_LIBSC|nr:hypothetical protein CKC_03095 [Candidatus Liberibacter solanacearum CLso-ZC1]